ncbi:MAG: TrmH family RNA methyltransferase, partial [Thermomicrobiales bacterium]
MVFGNETRGLTQEAMGQADGEIYIPMMGMVQSLNISVSCAVTLYELRRQRDVAGFYASPGLSETEISERLQEWLQK